MDKLQTMFACGVLLMCVSGASAVPRCVTVSSGATIQAPYEVVFDTIVDTDSYPDWNPYIVRVFPAAVDITVPGTEFVLVVIQPLSGSVTFAAEIATSVKRPEDGHAQITYAFNRPLARFLGFPERTQDVTRVGRLETEYGTSETFCGPLIGLLPLDDVQAGFDAQTAALAAESRRRFRASHPPCTGRRKGTDRPRRGTGTC